MTRKTPDHFDWFGALNRSTEQAREARGPVPLRVVTECRCGDTEEYGRETKPKADLRGEDIDAIRAEGIQRCRACPHAIHVGAMCIRRSWATSTANDYYHPECVDL